MTETRLLILGVPRSGTTLLTTLIGAHPDVAMLNEDLSYAMKNLVSKRIAGNKLCIPNHIDFEPSIISQIARRYGARFYRGQSVASLNEYLQDDRLKLIIIVRDPRASVASMMDRGSHTYTSASERWKSGTEIAFRLHRKEKKRVLLVSFEELVQEPEANLEAVSDFLDLTYDPQMTQGWKGTHYSNRGGIQSEKAQSGDRADLPGDISMGYPEAYEKYRTLRAACLTVSKRHF